MFARLLGLRTISPRGLHQLMQNESVTAVDVNPRASWVEARVPGALNLDPLGFDHDDLRSEKDATLWLQASLPTDSGEARAPRPQSDRPV